MFRPLRIDDAPSIAHLHCEGLADDFLPALGPAFLKCLYTAMLADNQVFGYIAEDEGGGVCGFILGCEQTGQLFRRTLTRRPLPIMVQVLKALLRKPYLLKNVMQTLLYPGKEPDTDVEAELIVIIIKQGYRGKGIGRELVSLLTTTLLKRGITAYKVTVNSSNESANLFYQTLGGQFARQLNIYGKDWNMYIYQL